MALPPGYEMSNVHRLPPAREVDPVHLLREQRQNALTEIDQAAFSWVSPALSILVGG